MNTKARVSGVLQKIARLSSQDAEKVCVCVCVCVCVKIIHIRMCTCVYAFKMHMY